MSKRAGTQSFSAAAGHIGVTLPPPPALQPATTTLSSSFAEHISTDKIEENNNGLWSQYKNIAAWIPTPPGWPKEQHVFRRDLAAIPETNKTRTDSGYVSKRSSSDHDLDANAGSSVPRTELPVDGPPANEHKGTFRSAEISPYQYKSLPSSDSFRLLRIHNKTGPVHCTLETYDLTHHPEYCTVSYCWGSKEELVSSAAITMNTHQVKISPVLYKILLHFQASNLAMPFWIDALCINRCDESERRSQFKILRDIFKQANTAAIWMENASESTASTASNLLVSRVYPVFLSGGRPSLNDNPHQTSSSLFPTVTQKNWADRIDKYGRNAGF